jgi:hypothetical protein
MSKHNDDEVEIDIDAVEEVREVLAYAVEGRSWSEAEDALGLLNELLGYEEDIEDEDDEPGGRKRNHLEE